MCKFQSEGWGRTLERVGYGVLDVEWEVTVSERPGPRVEHKKTAHGSSWCRAEVKEEWSVEQYPHVGVSAESRCPRGQGQQANARQSRTRVCEDAPKLQSPRLLPERTWSARFFEMRRQVLLPGEESFFESEDGMCVREGRSLLELVDTKNRKTGEELVYELVQRSDGTAERLTLAKWTP